MTVFQRSKRQPCYLLYGGNLPLQPCLILNFRVLISLSHARHTVFLGT